MGSQTQIKIVAVVGASGSGKSTVVERLKADPQLSLSVIQVDHYYRDLSHLTYEQRDGVNFDHPDAIEYEALRKDLQALKRGQSVDAPIYDFTCTTGRVRHSALKRTASSSSRVACLGRCRDRSARRSGGICRHAIRGLLATKN